MSHEFLGSRLKHRQTRKTRSVSVNSDLSGLIAASTAKRRAREGAKEARRMLETMTRPEAEPAGGAPEFQLPVPPPTPFPESFQEGAKTFSFGSEPLERLMRPFGGGPLSQLGQAGGILNVLQERFTKPLAAAGTTTVQKYIPGEQEIERKAREFRSQGVGPVEAARQAYLSSDLPTASVPVLPFRVPLPGGRSFREVDLGVKGGIEFGIEAGVEIPLMAAGPVLRGLKVGSRAATSAIRKKLASTVDWEDMGSIKIPPDVDEVAKISLADDVPAHQLELPGFQGTQTDLLEGRIQAAIDRGEASGFHEQLADALKDQAEAAGRLEPMFPPDLAATLGAKSNDSAAGLSDFLNVIPGEKMQRAAVRSYEGKRAVAAEEIRSWVDQGDKKLAEAGIGRNVGGYQALTRKEGEGLMRALHGEGPVPEGMIDIYNDLRKMVLQNESDLIAFDGTFAKVALSNPHYFPRMWKLPKETPTGRSAAGVKPWWSKARTDEKFVDLLDKEFEPATWNPYHMMMLRRISQVEYIEGATLIKTLKSKGLTATEKTKPKGWRVPQAGPAFEGRPFVKKNGGVGFTQPVFTDPQTAGRLESIFGKRPSFKLGDVDVVKVTGAFADAAKRMKLFGSLFQHVDFVMRTGAVAFTPTGIRKGAPLKFPSLVARLANVSLRKSARGELREKILKDPDLRMAAEEGWQIGGDTSMLKRNVLDGVYDTLQNAPVGLAARGARRLRDISKFFEDGLFEGVYRESQVFALENFILPKLRRMHKGKGWSDRQIAAAAGEEVNKMFSTLGNYQRIFSSPGMQEFTRTVAFSPNESESWIRSAVSTVTGQNVKLWREYWVGMMLFLGITGNLINIASTGRPLGIESYLPITTNSPYSFLPGGIAYNSKFLAPQLPFTGRGGTPLTLDIVGQADTAFRWILNPPQAFTARYNLLPRAILNQASGKDFYGRPIESLAERTRQAVEDLFVPIGPGNIGDIARALAPRTQDIVPEGEGRLGITGSVVQMTGLNVRAEPTVELLNRFARQSGMRNPQTGVPIEKWADLEPFQKRELEEDEQLKGELERRRLTQVERNYAGAAGRQALAEIDNNRLEREKALDTEFLTGLIDARKFTDMLGDIQGETAAERAQADKDYQIFKKSLNESGQTQYPDDPNKRARVQYYQALEESQTASGRFLHDVFERKFDKLENLWTPSQAGYVKRNLHLAKHSPLATEYYTLRRKWSVFYSVQDEVFKGDPDRLAIYEHFTRLSGEPRKEFLDQYPWLPEVDRRISDIKNAMKELNPELDAFAVRFLGHNPRHPENIPRHTELAPWQGPMPVMAQ